jgi:hypothetical protein
MEKKVKIILNPKMWINSEAFEALWAKLMLEKMTLDNNHN